MAGGLGFEPRQAESESAVLPLDDPPTGLLARRRVRDYVATPGAGCKQVATWLRVPGNCTTVSVRRRRNWLVRPGP